MHAAVAELQMAARQLQLAGELDRSKYSQIVAQLREVTDALTESERRTGRRDAKLVDFGEILREALATIATNVTHESSAITTDLPEATMVAGPAHDLRDLFCSLIEYACTVGRNSIELRARLARKSGEVSAACSTEVVVQSAEVPDFLRRKLWDAARTRRGEVSLTSEPERCRIQFTLPIELGSGAVLA